MTKQFAGNVGQVSFQRNSVVMGIAGAQRIFELMDQKPETDEGYVTLVNLGISNGSVLVRVLPRPHSGSLLTFGNNAVFLLGVNQCNIGAGTESGLRRRHGRGKNHHNQPYKPLLRHWLRFPPERCCSPLEVSL